MGQRGRGGTVESRDGSTVESLMSASPPITADIPSDVRLRLNPGEVAIESIAHACFRIHSGAGNRILIDPYASRVWLGYDFPQELAADAILITHPHFDHDGGEFIGREVPWTPETCVLREPGSYTVAGFHIIGIRGKHADPWGKEFGQKNTIWRIEVDGLRIAHLGDNGPLTDDNLRDLGRVDILMMPIDAREHILKNAEVEAIRRAVQPLVLIPMHYRHPDLESCEDSPRGLGPIEPWLAGQNAVTRLKNNYATFTRGSLKAREDIAVFQHSPKVCART
jgi:L-ascorbate metabolism protein UlaG (beta-lactamase superfamily)